MIETLILLTCRFVLCVNQRLINTHMEKLRMSARITLDPDALRWTPLVHTNLALVDKENEAANGHLEGGKNGGADNKDGSADAGDRQVDVLNDSHVDKSKDGLVINGIAEYEDESASEDDDEGPIIRPRKRRRSNTLSDSGSDKTEEKVTDEAGVLKNEDKTNKELAGFDTTTSGKLNSAEGESGIIKKKMKLNDEESSAEASDDSADNSDSEDSSSSSSSSASSSSEDSDNGEPMDHTEGNPSRENEDTRKCSEDGSSESSSEINNSPAGVYSGFGSQLDNRNPLETLADMDSAFPRLSPTSFECKESNRSDSMAVDQDMNPVVDFPDTDSTALIKELSEEVFSIGATPSLGGQHSSDDEI